VRGGGDCWGVCGPQVERGGPAFGGGHGPDGDDVSGSGGGLGSSTGDRARTHRCVGAELGAHLSEERAGANGDVDDSGTGARVDSDHRLGPDGFVEVSLAVADDEEARRYISGHTWIGGRDDALADAGRTDDKRGACGTGDSSGLDVCGANGSDTREGAV
jgi:hypothetical protein